MPTYSATPPVAQLADSRESIGAEVTQENRSEVIRSLFPYDWPYVEKSGILDDFYYNPETGEDALTHILTGNIVSSPSGGFVVGGFHHAPSAELLWAHSTNEDGDVLLPTRVDEDHLLTANSAERRKYKKNPGDAWYGRVIINGLRKVASHINPATQEVEIKPILNSMYPDDHDALAVVQKIRYAYHNLDVSRQQEVVTPDGVRLIRNIGTMPLLDGETMLSVMIVMDPESKKIMTAYPLVGKGAMRLDDERYNALVRRICHDSKP